MGTYPNGNDDTAVVVTNVQALLGAHRGTITVADLGRIAEAHGITLDKLLQA